MAGIEATPTTRESIYTSLLIQRVVRADVWLRMVASGAIPISGDGAGAGGCPSYDGRDRETAREIEV